MDVLAVLWFGVKVMFLGMVIVFIGLFILIGIISLISLVIRKMQERLVAPVAKEIPTALAAEEISPESDPELVAVLMAAIMACEDSGKKLVVRSVRRIGGNAWGGAGRREQLGI